MKKTTRIILACILLVGIVAALAACSENTSKSGVPTDRIGATVQDNGGMAVRYGKYIYFVNGYAGESANNTFGEVVRGAICRVTLKNGVPDYTTVETIVPKNVFGEDTTQAGIYILGDYIYYNTPSVEKNSKREYKSSEGVLTRTSLNGSTTEVVEKLDDNDIILYAGDNSNYLVYSYDNYLYALDKKGNKTLLTASTAKDAKTDKQTYITAEFGGDYLVYSMYNYADSSNYTKDYLVFAYNLNTGKLTKILDSDIYNGNADRQVLYTTSLLGVEPTADGFILYYSKAGNDSGSGKYTGYYACSFAANNPVYSAAKEVRFTHDTTASYTYFKTLANGATLAFASDHIDAFNADGSVMVVDNASLRYDFKGSASSVTMTLVEIVETDTEVCAFYIYNSKFHYIKLFNKANDVYTVANENAIAFFSGKYNSSYVTYDIIDNVIYYLNDDMEDNAYYYEIPAFADITSETDIATGKILGIISKEDMMTLVAAAAEEE